jgi:prepilin-type processing-associated H-X9-DG protein
MQGGSQANQISKMIANASSGCGFNVFLPTSYAFNEAVLGWSTGTGRSHSRLRGLITRVPHSSDVILLGDASPRNSKPGPLRGWMVYNDDGGDDTLATFFIGQHENTDRALFDFQRHYGNMNALFCDGHAESVALPAQYHQNDTNISVSVGFPQ